MFREQSSDSVFSNEANTQVGEEGIEPPMVPMYVFYRHGLHILPTVDTLPKLDDVVFYPKESKKLLNHLMGLVGFEPTTFRLKARYSTIELQSQ